MDWGKALFLTLALFMALIVSFGIYMVSSDNDGLVHEDYYERGLNYDRLRAADSVQLAADTAQAAPKQ